MKRFYRVGGTGVLTCLLSGFMGCANGGSLLEDAVNKVKSDFGAINEKAERERAEIKARQQGEIVTQATELSASSKTEESHTVKPIQLIVPKEKRVEEAMQAALPNVKKVLAIHQCIRERQGLRQLNFHTVPGVDMSPGSLADYHFPNSPHFMKYHDRSKCVSITTLDQWDMPALNALRFRTVFFAEDSGETVSFAYLFKKVDDGSWKLAELREVH